jgi:glycogen debranching enzyme
MSPYAILKPRVAFVKNSALNSSGKQGKRVLSPELLEAHLSEAGLGHVSEIFEGDAPHRSCGCVAQAWSVAEVLRAYVEAVKGVKSVARAANLTQRTQATFRRTSTVPATA